MGRATCLPRPEQGQRRGRVLSTNHVQAGPCSPLVLILATDQQDRNHPRHVTRSSPRLRSRGQSWDSNRGPPHLKAEAWPLTRSVVTSPVVPPSKAPGIGTVLQRSLKRTPFECLRQNRAKATTCGVSAVVGFAPQMWGGHPRSGEPGGVTFCF